MSRRLCAREKEVLELARTGGDLDPHREHIETCRACREAVTVTRWLGDVATLTSRRTTLPSAESIWWRAQVVRKLLDRDEKEVRRTRPLAWIQIGGVTLAALTVLSIFLSGNLMASGLVETLTGLVGGSGVAVLAIAAVVSLATGALVAWQATQELG